MRDLPLARLKTDTARNQKQASLHKGVIENVEESTYEAHGVG